MNTYADLTHVRAARCSPPWGHGVELHIAKETRRAGVSTWAYVKDIVLERETEETMGAILPPAFKLGADEAQALMDSLWDCGIRPTQGSGSAGSLAATEAHLSDMRAIVAKQLSVELPKK